MLTVFATSGANILTINQTIPTNGCAAVTISAETSQHGGDAWSSCWRTYPGWRTSFELEILAGLGRGKRRAA